MFCIYGRLQNIKMDMMKLIIGGRVGQDALPKELSIILSHYVQLVLFWFLIAEKHIFNINENKLGISYVFIESTYGMLCHTKTWGHNNGHNNYHNQQII